MVVDARGALGALDDHAALPFSQGQVPLILKEAELALRP